MKLSLKAFLVNEGIEEGSIDRVGTSSDKGSLMMEKIGVDMSEVHNLLDSDSISIEVGSTRLGGTELNDLLKEFLKNYDEDSDYLSRYLHQFHESWFMDYDDVTINHSFLYLLAISKSDIYIKDNKDFKKPSDFENDESLYSAIARMGKRNFVRRGQPVSFVANEKSFVSAMPQE